MRDSAVAEKVRSLIVVQPRSWRRNWDRQIYMAIPFDRGSESEVEPQCYLTSTVSAVFRGLRGLQHAKRARVAHVCRRWRKIGVVENVSERRFET